MQVNQELAFGLTTCPNCAAPLRVPFEAANRQGRCCHCGSRFAVPPADDLFDDAVAFLVNREDDDDGDDEVLLYPRVKRLGRLSA